MKRKKLHKIYVKALALIPSKEFWIQGQFEDFKNDRQCYCLAGALRMAALGNADDESLDDELEKVIEECIETRYPNKPGSITSFNDDDTTKYKHIRRVLTCAIADTDKKLDNAAQA